LVTTNCDLFLCLSPKTLTLKRKLTPAELRWITGIMESTPTGIAVQLAADALFSDYRPELVKLSQETRLPHYKRLAASSAATIVSINIFSTSRTRHVRPTYFEQKLRYANNSAGSSSTRRPAASMACK
jgi:hypothetical protein